MRLLIVIVAFTSCPVFSASAETVLPSQMSPREPSPRHEGFEQLTSEAVNRPEDSQKVWTENNLHNLKKQKIDIDKVLF